MELTDGLSKIAELLTTKPHLKEELVEIAKLITGKTFKKKASGSKGKVTKSTEAKKGKKARISLLQR